MPIKAPPAGTTAMVSIKDIQLELGCKVDRATQIMRFELPHYDVSTPGSKKPRWRAKRKDFDKWLLGRRQAAGRELAEAFASKYLRGGV